MPDKPLETIDQPPVIVPPILPQPINGQTSGLSHARRHTTRIIWRVIALVIAILIGSGLAAWLWYGVQLTPVSGDKDKLIPVTIVNGSTPAQIGQLLQDKSVIRSGLAFDINTRLSGTRGQLKMGTYRLSPGQSIPQIVAHLVSGKVDEFSIIFYPGATLVDTTTTDKKKRLDVTTMLAQAGYSQQEISVALKKTYNSPLFEGKPAGSDLEGYVYGDTYNFNAGASLEEVLQRTFDEFAKVVRDNDLVAGFQQQGLTLYQGITLASIVQREVNGADQKQVAQVFYSRLKAGITLGSDVTYQYAADKLGIARDVNLDSPYNTRRYTGLPPGPIASPGLSALQAVATPASGDYMFFLSGDDGITYFARTEAEHQANIKNHCAVKCSVQ